MIILDKNAYACYNYRTPEMGGVFTMLREKYPKNRLVKAVFAVFLVFMSIFSTTLSNVVSAPVYAEPVEEIIEETTDEIEPVVEETAEETEQVTEKSSAEGKTTTNGASCKDSLGSVGWLVCPVTGVISKAVDTMYNLIRDILIINPVEMKDGQPVYEMWKYFRAITNVVFIIFLLIVIYSQITGLGINNYGIKRALPKLIVMAILVNLSFAICSIAVDVSNIVGNSLRSVFENVEATSIATMNWDRSAYGLQMAEMYDALAGGIAIGGIAIAFNPGSIFMLIPVALGAIVAVISGLITIALRQAVVVLLIMVAPLAMVANILPNTEPLFKKWKSLLIKMLVFYPMFSVLFGASHLAGFAIIASAKDGFGLLLGIAVQIFPLFFSWKMMEMSGTILGTINSKLRGLADKPLSASRGLAESYKNWANAKQLEKRDPYALPTRLKQFVSDRKINRENETKEMMNTVVNRGLAYGAKRNFDEKGLPTKEGEEAYERISRNLRYTDIITRDKNNMNKGLGQLEAVKKYGTATQKARLSALDKETAKQSDLLKAEIARGELIDYRNAMGFYNRMENAINVHMDEENGYITDQNGNKIARTDYKFHIDPKSRGAIEAQLNRYDMFKDVMEGEVLDTQYVGATAAQGYDTQAKIISAKFNKYFDMLPPTKDLAYRMKEFSLLGWSSNGKVNATQNIDAIIAGLRVINQRGDTDIVQDIMYDLMDKKYGGLELGTHASQALASFLMFEVKDNDPFLRRFGKYINLETAAVYNDNKRKDMTVTYDEYVKGYHVEPDGSVMYAKKGMKELLEGTSLENIERTALGNLDESLKRAYGFVPSDDPNKPQTPWDVKKYLKKREEIQTAFEPAFLSAGMRWMSGSEQINSGVKFWMGYETKQKTKMVNINGKNVKQVVTDKDGNPIYEMKPVWESKDYAGHEDEVKKYYHDRAMAFCKDQTTGQILGMRTDFRDPLVEHLLNEYLEGDSAEEPNANRLQEYNAKYSDIQTRYANLPPDEAKEKREKDIVKLKREFSGRQLRKILDDTGKLKQIYQTRTSGTAVNAKDWLRKMVGLDDEDGLRTQLTKSELEKTKNRIVEDTTSTYYAYTHDLLKSYFGDDALILKKYEKIFGEKKFQDDLANEEKLPRDHRMFYNAKNTKLYNDLMGILNS